jgi:mono/diheme cytochrome c family protein
MRPLVSWFIAAGLCACTATVWSATLGSERKTQIAVRSVNDGVYSAAQARSGEDLFVRHCGSCHEPDRFTGPTFLENWEGPLDVVFKSVRTSMPEDNPGGLAPQVYADIIAYWLNLNGYPAGAERLEGTFESMHAVHLEAPAAANTRQTQPR